ncbi:MAG TPA: hypothetical protein VIJ61_05070 [Thermoanaerobaculia bacterium]
MVDPQKELINELKVSVQENEGFEIEKPLSEDELEEASGGACQCHCAYDSGGGGSCGGGGGGGGAAAFEEIAT